MIEIRESKKNVLDEVVAKNCTIHLERTNKKHWILAIYDQDGSEARVEFYDCGMVSVNLLNDAEQRNEAVALGQTCPSCAGIGGTMTDVAWINCSVCNGTGHV